MSGVSGCQLGEREPGPTAVPAAQRHRGATRGSRGQHILDWADRSWPCRSSKRSFLTLLGAKTSRLASRGGSELMPPVGAAVASCVKDSSQF